MKRLMCAILMLAVLLMNIAVCAENESDVVVPETAKSGKTVECEREINLAGSEATIRGGGAEFADGVLTVKETGSYLVSGELDGVISVDVSKDKKVELCLNGVFINGGIIVVNAPKNVTLTVCEDSVNIIHDSSDAAAEGEKRAAILSPDDIKIRGTGALYIISDNNRGIHCSDDISIDECELFVISGDNGIHGKDSVKITGGSVYVKSGADGIKSTNAEDDDKGFVLIEGGSVTIVSANDGIQAENYISIQGGEVTITAGGGHTASAKVHADEFRGGRGFGGKDGRGGFGNPGGFGGNRWQQEQIPETAETSSMKGLKAAVSIAIEGGSLVIDSADDAVHSGGNTTVSGGRVIISTGDDGIHADSVLNISGGNIMITDSYEGLEGTVVNISGGEIRLKATDDGINGAGDDAQATTAANGQTGRFGGNGLGEINISGGYIVVNAGGDGVDSNNIMSVSGGTLIVYGPVENMNSAIDYENSCRYTGGTILAVGSSGMAQTVSAEESGAVLTFRVSMPAETLMTITDENGGNVISFSSPKSYQCVVYASDLLVKEQAYNVYSGGENRGSVNDYIYSGGNTDGGVLLGSVTAK